MTLTLHRFVPLLALAFPGDALAQNAPEPPVNNGHDLTRPLHSITVFQNYTAPFHSGILCRGNVKLPQVSSFRDAPKGAGPESITPIGGYGFRARRLRVAPE